jgi:peptidyl-prolyl cis-trans isomerase A (cyclophilin A)
VAEDLTATVRTTMGTIVLRLFPDQAPKTVQNFVGLAEGTTEWTDPRTGQRTTEPLYNGTIFHRVIDKFMLQGGDPLGTGTGGPGHEFEDEFHPDLRFNRPYLLAMANAGPGTNGSQFFIFGEVVQGSDIVEAIGKTETDRGDRPVKDVVVESVTIDRR